MFLNIILHCGVLIKLMTTFKIFSMVIYNNPAVSGHKRCFAHAAAGDPFTRSRVLSMGYRCPVSSSVTHTLLVQIQ